jgi:hypothetical protein
LYPKDAKTGGTWITLTQTGNAAVLLNGAFEKHIVMPAYRKSRGLVFLDIIHHSEPGLAFTGINLEGIEPFTLVLFLNGVLFEARWDGIRKYFIRLDANKPHIWSSATLYSYQVICKRKQWFDQWLTETDSPTASGIFNFHRFAGDGDTANSILMNRDDEMLTFSITGIELTGEGGTMRHFDVKDNTVTNRSLQFETITS